MKSQTDLFWNERALNEKDQDKVNIGDIVQREFEYTFVEKHLRPTDNLLEVGCGNGFLSQYLREKVNFLDSFDYAENMVEKAVELRGQKNNRFFHDDVTDPKNFKESYSAILCIRVLINLKDLESQKKAIANLHKSLEKGGMLLLIEGYKDGFDALSELRQSIGLTPLTPAAINFYSKLNDILPLLNEFFEIQDYFHSGMYDFLTRVVYPALVGSSNVIEAGEFHQKILPLIKTFNLDGLSPYARLHGYKLIKK
ncbi:MAG: class I SAM-dependent methyltransferase [Victivallales bacterium]|nr:class I SAM-dependent methyltransferase [Victivallales bacterium]